MVTIVDQLLADAGIHPRQSTSHNLRVRILRIGPSEAKALLAANRDNRKLRPGRVKYYAKIMLQGGWRLTHQGIAFCVDGRGLDLQHRLWAIIESGVTIDMMVTEGLDADAFEAIDQHERRSIADALRVDRPLVDVVKLLILARGGDAATNPTTLEVGEVCAIAEDLHAQLIEACNSRRAIYSSAPIRAAAIVLMSEKPAQKTSVMENYRLFCLDRSEFWTRTMHAFGRQVRTGQIRTTGFKDRLDLMTRALIALDPDRAHLSKIQLSDDTIKTTRNRVTKMIGESELSVSDESCDLV